jgi:hypothetical protein
MHNGFNISEASSRLHVLHASSKFDAQLSATFADWYSKSRSMQPTSLTMASFLRPSPCVRMTKSVSAPMQLSAELMMVAMRWETKRIWAAPMSGSLYPCRGMTSEATAFQEPGANCIALTRLA